MCTAVRDAGSAGGQGQVLGSTAVRDAGPAGGQGQVLGSTGQPKVPSNPAFFISYTAAKQKLWTVL